jgi:drug/metabolite transporter (DMT)-like permease
MVFGGMHPLGAKGERVTLILRGVFGFLGFALCYVAYRMIPFADASTIVYSAPVYVSLFAFVLLKEECGLFQTLTIGLTIAGVLLISKPTFLFGSHSSGGSITDSTLRLEGSIFAFLSSLCSAASFVLMRRLQKTPSAVVISIISIITIIMGILVLTLIVYFFKNDVGILARGVGIPESPEEILWLIANGLCGVFGQLCLTVSLKIEEAGLVSLGRTFDILMAFIFQVAFLHTEIVHWTSIVGGVIVCFGVCISALRRWLRGKPNEYSVLWMLLNCGISRTQDDDISSNKKLDTNDNRKKNVCCVPSNTSSLETLDGVPSPNQFETVMQQENTIDKSEENIV